MSIAMDCIARGSQKGQTLSAQAVAGSPGAGGSTNERRSHRRLSMLKRLGLFGGNTRGATVERAITGNDLCQAYELVHDVYLETGYIEPERTRMRLRMFESAPQTATFVAKVNGRVVGAVSIVADSPELGLPSDSAFEEELDEIRRSGARMCEWTNQSVAEDYRKSALATELMRCAAAHVIWSGYDQAIATVSPSHGSFYQLLGFREIGSVRSYSERIYDPVVALAADVGQYRRPLTNADLAERFVHDFMAGLNPFLQRVEEWDRVAARNFLSRALLRNIFVSQTHFVAERTLSEIEILRKQWGQPLFAAVTEPSFPERLRHWAAMLVSFLDVMAAERFLPGAAPAH